MAEYMDPEELDLFLAAEECPAEDFSTRHSFDAHDERLIRALIAHGPVLIRGGRGAGKSALLIEANRRLKSDPAKIGVYISLRYLPLLQKDGADYLAEFVQLVVRAVRDHIAVPEGQDVFAASSIEELKQQLIAFSRKSGKRLVLLFDDPAHIGRESSLDEFFASFRVLSCAEISCKASIYPGVTRFGIRFDVFNDATVLDVSKDERIAGYNEFFLSVASRRRPAAMPAISGIKNMSAAEVAGFIGRTVLGNMRAYVVALDRFERMESADNLNILTRLLLDLAADHFWGLFDEVKPKLGRYEPMVAVSDFIAQFIFTEAGSRRNPNVVIRREICQTYAKPLEILEYVGFIVKRDSSRGIQGGRGPRYRLNLAVLLENVRNKKLSAELIQEWSELASDVVEISPPSAIQEIAIPPLPEGNGLSILNLPIDNLLKGKAYPYGITPNRLDKLKAAGFHTVADLAKASDESLDAVYNVGQKWIDRIRGTVTQAVWM